MIKRVIPVLFGVMLVAAMLPVQGQRRGLSEGQLEGLDFDLAGEWKFSSVHGLPACGSVGCTSAEAGALCQQTFGAGDGDAVELRVCACSSADTPCSVYTEMAFARSEGALGTERTLPVAILNFGDGTAADQTINFDLDTDQTIIWDESADGFVFSKEVLPPSDDGQDLGDPQLRYSDVHATEGRFFCPGGPTSGAGATICYDPDDPEGPAWKLQIGGSTFYVQVSQTHP